MSVNLSDDTRDFLLYFLLYSYFGITAEDLKDTDKIITICAQRAYLDLNRTLMFKPEFKDSTTNDTKAKHDRTKERKKFRDQMCDIIKKNVCSLMKSNSHEDYDKKHSDLCKTLQEAAKNYCEYEVNKDKKDGITYGQAQKWLNMTVKYMWLLGIWYDKFDKIHVPVDSYIIEAVKRKINFKDGMKVDTPKEAWSKWNDVDTYNKFQKSLRDAVKNPPIEWEGRAWIEIAQERNKQKNKQKNEECQ